MDAADPPEESETIGGFNDGISPGCETNAESKTVPENWLRLVSWIADDPVVEGGIVRLVGVAEILKSAVVTRTVIVVAWTFAPDVPVTLTA